MSNLVALNALKGAAGATGDSGVYIDDVFSTDLYTGDGVAKSINNGINLAGEGGLVWAKRRSATGSHNFIDTERGKTKVLFSDNNNAQATEASYLTSFNDNGFTIGTDSGLNAANDYVSTTFRKAPGFFDIITYTGNGTSGREIAHNLNANVGFLIVKRLDSSSEWRCWHRKLNGGTNVGQYSILLNTNDQNGTGVGIWNNTAPTSSVFTVGNDNKVNADGGSYVAYLFAHHDGDGNFGPDNDKDAIKCGTYTGNGGSLNVVVGWEPQWLLIKNYDGYDANWQLFDNMRAVGTADLDDSILNPNTTGAEFSQDRITFQGNGFRTTENDSDTDANGHKFLYVAIRKKDGVVGKLPSAGTDVFAMDTGNDSSTIPCFDSGFPVDFAFRREPASTDNWFTSARGMENRYVDLNSATTMANDTKFLFDHNAGWHRSKDSDHQSWMFRQHQGLDVSFYRGTGGNNDKHHNLGRVPEMIWCKCLDNNGDWTVYHKDLNSGTNPHDYRLILSTTAAEAASDDWGGAGETSLVFSVSGEQNVNNSNDHYMAICFASVDGICKVGSYTGTGTSSSSTKEITTGFSPRLIVIKRISSTGGWLVFDTVRGISNSGDDKRLEFNETAAQDDTDVISTTSSNSFTIKGNSDNSNNNGNRYIYWAHA